ncbi:MAG: SAM-dependent methyltransferase [Clostridium sp.]|nr:SAM-dependent methyltransferase [Clostridium sp.]
MNEVFRQIPLYRFLMFCNNSSLEKTVLDCGAGGNQPPLSLFLESGYAVTGLEYNSVFHMNKADIKKSLSEMKRVLKKDGLLFVNFLTTKDHRFKVGEDQSNYQYIQIENGIPTIHSYFDEKETDKLFKDMKILYKEDRVLERIYEGYVIRQGFIDYIVQKI